MEVAVWWNERISSKGVKRKQLYLSGPTNVGKSTYVERLIGRNNMKYVFYPGVGIFFMQGFKVGYHQIILFEEFSYKFCVPSMLKRLLEGRPYAYPRKCEADLIFKFSGPVIFVSNECDETMDDALKSRLCFVSANEPFWEEVEEWLPKAEAELEEDDGEEEVVLIETSESEEESV